MIWLELGCCTAIVPLNARDRRLLGPCARLRPGLPLLERFLVLLLPFTQGFDRKKETNLNKKSDIWYLVSYQKRPTSRRRNSRKSSKAGVNRNLCYRNRLAHFSGGPESRLTDWRFARLRFSRRRREIFSRISTRKSFPFNKNLYFDTCGTTTAVPTHTLAFLFWLIII